MKALHDPGGILSRGLADIRTQFQVPASFPPQVLAAAEAAAARTPDAHVDRTAVPFVTLDPATSTDLDQAFAIERSGGDLVLRYAIADVAWFVADGDPVDVEAWHRGETLYLPDGKAGLYPPVLAEKAASLLPDGPRPAVVFAVRVAPDGETRLDGVERALVRSRAKLAYDRVRPADMPDGFAELAERIAAAETRRGAARVDPPQQEVVGLGHDRFALAYRPMLASEEQNAALSLASNLAVARALLDHHTGLFRVMAGPDAKAVARLRQTAGALALDWPAGMDIKDFERTLDPADPHHAAFMLAVRRAGSGAGYAPYHAGAEPWHAAIAAPYAHATAPLRRLADRYVIRAALAVANGQAVPDEVVAAFDRLPEVMARADALAGRIERAVIDLAETVMLHGREGEVFRAVVTDTEGPSARIHLEGLPVVARTRSPGAAPGTRLAVRLEKADPAARTLAFVPA
ncbi:RNB domain-containing ribonuclease [Novosphingobium sp. KCTC 2891]|uniref:RNB domain-containing ribonuclease n=1 Tax=Novosphingobium sp. KCTC 2891 TaxID=2989730 RepID=UPI0022231B76|nr:RNB domain-containing ribonuclease [Novosphingobium sp. KCTC 2891]MCW1381939.1 RNB domain-containing ribonuclease [Novosphingobium sp. KCTC 2891]